MYLKLAYRPFVLRFVSPLTTKYKKGHINFIRKADTIKYHSKEKYFAVHLKGRQSRHANPSSVWSFECFAVGPYIGNGFWSAQFLYCNVVNEKYIVSTPIEQIHIQFEFHRIRKFYTLVTYISKFKLSIFK